MRRAGDNSGHGGPDPAFLLALVRVVDVELPEIATQLMPASPKGPNQWQCGMSSIGGDVMDARSLLVQAGWVPGRSLDVARGVESLVEAGYELTPSAHAVLREFSGLTVTSQDGVRRLWVDGERAASVADPAWCGAYQDEAGRVLVPVGGYSHMILLVDDVGSFWGGLDAEFGKLADSFEDLLRVLLVAPGSARLDRTVRTDP